MKVHIFDVSLEKFIKGLQKPTITKILRTIDLLDKFDPKLGPPHAKKIGTKQSAISRLESGTYNPSFSFLHKVSEALDTKVKISLLEK